MGRGHTGVLALLGMGIVLTLPALAQDSKANDAGSGNSVARTGGITTAKIFYSGHMFGYLREDGTACKPPRTAECHVSESAQRFSEALEGQYSLEGEHSPEGQHCKYPEESDGKYVPGTCVLLGMGDNFSPKYEARLDDQGSFKSRNQSEKTVVGQFD